MIEDLKRREEEKERTAREKEDKEEKRKELEKREKDIHQWTENKRIRFDWTKGISAMVRQPAATQKVTEKTTSPEKMKVEKAVKHWFGEDSDSSEDEIEEEKEKSENWNKVDRQRKSIERKEKAGEKKKKKKEEVLEKVKHMVGIGPIDIETIDYYIKEEKGDFEKTKKAVIR